MFLASSTAVEQGRQPPALCVEVLSSDRTADTVVRSMTYAAQGVAGCRIVELEREAVDVPLLL